MHPIALARLAIFLILAVPVCTVGQSEEPVAAPSGPMAATYAAYKHLIEGNRSDLQRNRKAQAFYSEKATETSSPQRKAQFQKLATAYENLGDINETTLNALKGGDVGLARQALADLPQHEAIVQEITRKPIERDWLSFAEVEAYHKRFGFNFKTENRFVLPFHRKHWDQNELRKSRDDQATRK